MLSQIIFFVAVALLIILLARRMYAGSLTGKAGTALYGTGNKLVNFFVNGWRKMMGLAQQRTNRSQPTHQGVPVQLSGGHEFWHDESVEDKPELASHYEEGDKLFKEKKYREAEQFFLKAAANNPKDAKAYARLGLIYLQQKSYSDAIESLKVAVKLDKYNPSRHYNLSLAYMGNKDIQKAIASVREAISIDPVTPKYRALLEQLLNG